MTALELMKSIGQVDDDLLLNIASPKEKKRYPVTRILRIAAVAAVLLLLAGCAVVFFLKDSGMMETIFGSNGRTTYAPDIVWRLYEPGGERTELDEKLAKKFIDPYVFPIEGTLKDGETTLTAVSCLVDRTSCTAALRLKLENPPEYEVYNSGRLLFKTARAEDSWYVHPRGIGQGDMIGRLFVDEASTTEKELYFVLIFSCEPSCTAVELSLGHEPDSITIPFPEETNLPSLILADGDIAISPWGMKVKAAILSQDTNLPDRKPGVQYHIREEDHPRTEVAIRFKDGTEYLVAVDGLKEEDRFEGYTYGMALNTKIEDRVFVFNRVVDIENVATFRVNEHVYWE